MQEILKDIKGVIRYGNLYRSWTDNTIAKRKMIKIYNKR